MLYTVGETAKKMGVAACTLRYYDKEGLLPFVERTSGGIRMFSEKDAEWLRIIECLKKTGMSIKEIKTFVLWCMEGDATIDKRLELIDEQREKVKKQIAALHDTLDTLEYKHWYYQTAKAAGTCAVHQTITDEQIPPEILKLRDKIKR